MYLATEPVLTPWRNMCGWTLELNYRDGCVYFYNWGQNIGNPVPAYIAALCCIFVVFFCCFLDLLYIPAALLLYVAFCCGFVLLDNAAA